MKTRMQNKMNIILIIIGLIAISSCGKSDKATELKKLRKQQAELSQKIKKLEDELARDTNSNHLNTKKGLKVMVEEISFKPFNHIIEVHGKIDGDNSVNVYCEMSGGIVEEIYVKEGQFVKKNQILAKLDDKLLQTQLNTQLVQLEYVTTMYNKQKALWDQKIGSEAQYLDIKTKKEALENQIEVIKQQIQMCRIKSPISGSVEDIAIKKGQMVFPQIVAFRVVDLSTLKIVAEIAEGYSSRINEGDKVTVFLPDLNHELQGKVDFVSRYINPINRTFTVNLRIPSNEQRIKANMLAILRIVNYSNPKAIVVPINIVQKDQKGDYVLIAREKGLDYVSQKKYVTLGEISKGMVEVEQGLSVGDKVITLGFQELEEGQYINF